MTIESRTAEAAAAKTVDARCGPLRLLEKGPVTLRMLAARKLSRSLMWWLTRIVAELPCCMAAGPDSSEIDRF